MAPLALMLTPSGASSLRPPAAGGASLTPLTATAMEWTEWPPVPVTFLVDSRALPVTCTIQDSAEGISPSRAARSSEDVQPAMHCPET